MLSNWFFSEPEGEKKRSSEATVDLDEDELAEQLLTQFPPYGQHQSQSTALPDWLVPEESKDLPPITPPRPSPPTVSPAWDDEEQRLWNRPASPKVETEHWMPDQLCKQCYNCEAPFTVFRRRHHCRLCGQVFCNTCSAYFVNHMRVCADCHDAQQEPEPDGPALEATLQPRHVDMLEDIAEEVASVQSAEPSTDKPWLAFPKNSSMDSSWEEGHRHLGRTAANHLELVAESLLQAHAPLLWNQLPNDAARQEWIHQLLTLATRSCATVEPNVQQGDLLDIRPYCKLKVIPGGEPRDCAYLSGVLFRKTVSHKRMAKELRNPTILLLSGGIEFTRAENRIASLETLFEQESKYMEILVGKILKLQPSLVLVGKSVSRRAQELLLQHNVVLIQQVKVSLLNRIARQTGGTVISGTDHIMNQFGAKVLGKCCRFRLVTFRDNELWADASIGDEDEGPRVISDVLEDEKISAHERQMALAAMKLGESPLDGAEAVKCGLAKRGVAQTYVMFEGCPKNLGCTIILRGARKAALKQVKGVLRFLINAAYNLRLETSYFRERGARLRPDYVVRKEHACSSSLCVDYGSPANGRKTRPWNGGNTVTPAADSGEITALDHQSILVTSVWMTEKSQCCPAEVKGICYYSLQDVALGQFLRDSCFNLSLKCQNPNCKKSVLDHSLSFVHNDGLLNIVVEELDTEVPMPSGSATVKPRASDGDEGDLPISTWTYCPTCQKVVSPLVSVSDNTWKLSFGKFLEVYFYNHDTVMNGSMCRCSANVQTSTWLYFGCGRLAARFSYEKVHPFGVFVRPTLPLDPLFHHNEALRRLEQISVASSVLFVKFDKHIDRIAREARTLFQSAVNRPEHLQTVISELNVIGSEVDLAAKTVQEKIASVTDNCHRSEELMSEAFIRFAWFARRYLFMIMSAWNEKLSATGQAISTMRKIARSANRQSDVSMTPTTSGPSDAYNDELVDAMKRLRTLNERYSRYNVTDINEVLPSVPGIEDVQDADYDDDFDEPGESSVDFTEGVDADVIASRRRLKNVKAPGATEKSVQLPKKSLGTRRTDTESVKSSTSDAPHSAQKATPGGAVKSAINRLFNRGGRESDPYVVDLGIFAEGRPRLHPGVDGIVLPVMDEQWSTIIAYSLSSSEYGKQFRYYSRHDVSSDVASSSEEAGRRGQRPRSPPVTSRVAEGIEGKMLVRNKSHIKHTFRDHGEKGQVTAKFVCTSYWATQFHAVRQVFLRQSRSENAGKAETEDDNIEKGYIESLSSAYSWAASGGKSGASFARTSDDRFVIKCISRTELQMFLDCAPAYFEYLSKAFFHGL